MQALSKAFLKILLQHHKSVTKIFPPPSSGEFVVRNYTLSYSTLCELAEAPAFIRNTGRFLREIAEWCRDNNYPPLNSLVVSTATGMPGELYNEAGGFLMNDWPKDVRMCIRFKNYPTKP